MKRRSSGSADDGDDASSDPESCDRAKSSAPAAPARQSRSTSSRHRNGHDWKLSGHGVNGYPGVKSIASAAGIDNPSLAPPTSTAEMAPASVSRLRQSRTWSSSILAVLTAACGIALMLTIIRSLVVLETDQKGCRMSYMRPSYVRFSEFDTEHTRFATKYSLYLYREQGIDETKLHGIPVLFIPGNAGSYKQVRPIAAEAANFFHDELQHKADSIDAGVRNLDFFTVDFNEDITAFHGQTLLDQAEYLNEAIRYILTLYTDPGRASRDPDLPDPSSVIILGHSMGGIVARTMLVQPNYQPNSINTIITMSAPHARPPVTFDGQIVQIYDEINVYWRRAYSEKWANNNPLWHVTLVSIAGGSLDTVVPSDYASLESLVPDTHGFTVFTTGIPGVWTSMDHQAILWCDQFRKVVSRALHDVVDVHRASQTKPRAERMSIFKKRFLSGLEPAAERLVPQAKATTLLTLNDKSHVIVPTGDRLVLPSLGERAKPMAHLIPIPPQISSDRKRFSLLTDSAIDRTGENGQLELLLCSIYPSQSMLAGSLFAASVDLSGNERGSKTSTRLACKNAADDLILLPASTRTTQHPFQTDGQSELRPFSYLEYDMEHLHDHQFIAVVEKAAAKQRNFVIAEFSEESDYVKTQNKSLWDLLLFGMSFRLPTNEAMAVEVSIPSVRSALLAYHLEVETPNCPGRPSLFAPLARQHIERPYESKFFVNVRETTISLHGVAPYVPPALEPGHNKGLSFTLWADPTCEGEYEIKLKLDVMSSFGKLYMRYRTIFAAFPLLIVTLVLRKQFRVYDDIGVFISFSDSLDLCLRQSIPLLLVSLTLLSMSMGEALALWNNHLWRGQATKIPLLASKFNENDLLIGTEDPFFWFLVPLIGIVSIGVCTAVHYATLVLTRIFGVAYNLVRAPSAATAAAEDSTRPEAEESTNMLPFTPRRRIITTAILLFLVWTFIPYQFAYLVACLVQLFTVVRALRANMNASSHSSSNFYNYTHSIFLLMLWVLPINLPILAVWIRNLAVHWLTPFSSHHNVLSIMPFILLVENLTTGRMVPRVTTSLRFVTSVLLFGTALCAAIYGVSHAYLLHYFVNVVATWIVIIHASNGIGSLASYRAIFQDDTKGPPPGVQKS